MTDESDSASKDKIDDAQENVEYASDEKRKDDSGNIRESNQVKNDIRDDDDKTITTTLADYNKENVEKTATDSDFRGGVQPPTPAPTQIPTSISSSPLPAAMELSAAPITQMSTSLDSSLTPVTAPAFVHPSIMISPSVSYGDPSTLVAPESPPALPSYEPPHRMRISDKDGDNDEPLKEAEIEDDSRQTSDSRVPTQLATFEPTIQRRDEDLQIDRQPTSTTSSSSYATNNVETTVPSIITWDSNLVSVGESAGQITASESIKNGTVVGVAAAAFVGKDGGGKAEESADSNRKYQESKRRKKERKNAEVLSKEKYKSREGVSNVPTVSPTSALTTAPVAPPSAMPTKPHDHPELVNRIASDSWFFLGKAPPPTPTTTPTSIDLSKTKEPNEEGVMLSTPIAQSTKSATVPSSVMPPSISIKSYDDAKEATSEALKDKKEKATSEEWRRYVELPRKSDPGNLVLPPLQTVTPSYAPSPHPFSTQIEVTKEEENDPTVKQRLKELEKLGRVVSEQNGTLGVEVSHKELKERVDKMSKDEMKVELQRRGVDISGLVKKGSIRKRLKKAIDRDESYHSAHLKKITDVNEALMSNPELLKNDNGLREEQKGFAAVEAARCKNGRCKKGYIKGNVDDPTVDKSSEKQYVQLQQHATQNIPTSKRESDPHKDGGKLIHMTAAEQDFLGIPSKHKAVVKDVSTDVDSTTPSASAASVGSTDPSAPTVSSAISGTDIHPADVTAANIAPMTAPSTTTVPDPLVSASFQDPNAKFLKAHSELVASVDENAMPSEGETEELSEATNDEILAPLTINQAIENSVLQAVQATKQQ